MRIWQVAAVAALAACVGATSSAVATTPSGQLEASGSFSPAKLPPTDPAPVALTIGFRSPPVEGAVRGIEEISFGVNSAFEFAGRWPQRCSLAILYSRRDPLKDCATALVGRGSVTSEISAPGKSPVVVTGQLQAFYSYGGGQPRILAKVTTGEPLPLIYVIPFTVRPGAGPLKPTTLTVPRSQMRGIAGKCASEHPNCFAPNPYSIYGVYSQISDFTMTLHRVERRQGHRLSFVSGRCSLADGKPFGDFPFLQVSLSYEETLDGGEGAASILRRTCNER